MSLISIPKLGTRSVAAISSRACGKVRSALAGSRATRDLACVPTVAGSSGPGSPPQHIPRVVGHRLRLHVLIVRDITAFSSTPQILEPGRGQCSRRSLPMHSTFHWSVCISKLVTRCCRVLGWPVVQWEQPRGELPSSMLLTSFVRVSRKYMELFLLKDSKGWARAERIPRQGGLPCTPSLRNLQRCAS